MKPTKLFGTQIRDVEQIHRTCADRERRLQRLCRWTEQQQKQLEQSRKPTCRSAAAKDLLELEVSPCLGLVARPPVCRRPLLTETPPPPSLPPQAVGVRVAEVFATLQELKSSRVHARKAKAHPCDLLFSAQTDSVCHIFRDLQKQVQNNSSDCRKSGSAARVDIRCDAKGKSLNRLPRSTEIQLCPLDLQRVEIKMCKMLELACKEPSSTADRCCKSH